MPLSDRDRLAASLTHPRIVDLWFALTALRSVTGFMQSGAHPDDETSPMLAALRYRDGLAISYACSTRGEGGQNDIGTEAGADLGILRTAEMERAAERLDMVLWWLPEAPGDSLVDFGFSKSGSETLEKWGRARTLARFVDIVRAERPDILCPTFLDVPGQHGHHRAMTEAAHLVLDAAADPGFAGSALPVWQVSKLYLPAWGGGGTAYDDEVPPPPETVAVPAGGVDPVTGWSFAEIGEQSRLFHATQGMGRWPAPGSERDWPLHLARSGVGRDQIAVTDNLPATLADIGLPEAQTACDAAIAAFPDDAGIITAAGRALHLIRAGRDAVPPADRHRLIRKEAQLARVLRFAAGIAVRGYLARDWLLPGETVGLTVEGREGSADSLAVAPALPEGWAAGADGLTVAADAAPSNPSPVHYDPLIPALPCLRAEFTVDGIAAACLLAFEVPPQILPKVAGTLAPDRALINLALPAAPLRIALTGMRGSAPALTLPEGWSQDWTGARAVVTPSADLQPGHFALPLTVDGVPAQSERRLTHPHIAPRLRSSAAGLRVLATSIALPAARVGYVGAGKDDVAHWLAAMGCDVAVLDDPSLGDPDAFDAFDAIVIGVFAMRFRPALRAALPRLHRWVRDGGTLLTLYHRPWDGWDPQTTPPLPLEIGQPSLRWRVTDENAAVTHLAPDHPVLAGPNRIGPADWQGWVKERGLYFAKSWDAAYTPLLSMADPGEAPHRGALLSADIGKGRHTHCALGLQVQMAALVPGAFRLMANLIAPR